MEKKEYLCLNSKSEFLMLDISKVVFFKASGRVSDIYFYDGKGDTVQMNLAQIKEALDNNLKNKPAYFVRIGDYILNLNYIRRIESAAGDLLLGDVKISNPLLKFTTEELEALKEKCISLASTQD